MVLQIWIVPSIPAVAIFYLLQICFLRVFLYIAHAELCLHFFADTYRKGWFFLQKNNLSFQDRLFFTISVKRWVNWAVIPQIFSGRFS